MRKDSAFIYTIDMCKYLCYNCINKSDTADTHCNLKLYLIKEGTKIDSKLPL